MKPDAIVRIDVKPVDGAGFDSHRSNDSHSHTGSNGARSHIGVGDAQSDAQAALTTLLGALTDLENQVTAAGIGSAGLLAPVQALPGLVGDMLTKMEAMMQAQCDQRVAAQAAIPASTSTVPTGPPVVRTAPSGNVSPGTAAFVAVGSGVLGGIVGWAVRDSMKR